MYKGYLIDLDGTTYCGDYVIKSARNKINQWINEEKKILFITNNASKTNQEVANKLINMGYNVSSDMIYTSANAMGEYILKYDYKSCYVIGEDSLRDEINLKCCENPDVVIVGYTNKLTYEMLSRACNYINNGSDFLATNQDRAIPDSDNFIPGNGSVVKLLEYATNKKATFVGKPSNIIMDYAVKKIGINKNDLCMIGDNYDTDILAGINSGIDTIFVETGLTTLEQVNNQKIAPTYVCVDLESLELM